MTTTPILIGRPPVKVVPIFREGDIAVIARVTGGFTVLVAVGVGWTGVATSQSGDIATNVARYMVKHRVGAGTAVRKLGYTMRTDPNSYTSEIVEKRARKKASK